MSKQTLGALSRARPKLEEGEAQWIRRIAQGDRDSFSRLYDHYAKPLYSLAFRVVNDTKDAEDVLQEVFIKIWERAASFDNAIGNPFNWAVSITRNQSIDHLRTKQRRARVLTEAKESDVLAARSFVTEPAFDQEQLAMIRTAVVTLPDVQRCAIELAYFGGLTYIEIAEVLEEPLGTIKARIRRGMLRLRDCLAKPLMKRRDD